ncbi:MAG: CAAX protease family protein [Microbacterium sp. 71-36]|uniref:CPBP family intramembrane glutamic endopeptidase n=1 Tax=unclassified Microbacterium TaxID=2609290 RepID=UPI00086903AE|nr:MULTISPECIES: CPBP family intramembrane glutamic endopeptidase [unclassified Microbacterium]MBN9210244.1 CPBP family intramembrane metalloprotease [Microbacterium sp.]ODT37046.1 MAG: CAAX protease [Microbacterium sp. SCN 71-17]OJV77370.1 MAG: CAAX protease family protein [Microbacterium sp. 71-36]
MPRTLGVSDPGIEQDAFRRRRLPWEIVLVLLVSVGQSAIYSVVSFIRAATRAPISQQQTQLNPSRSDEPFWDAVYQFLGIFFSLALVALAVYLLWEPADNALRRIGLDFRRFGSDVLRGLALVALIGVPGIGVYAVGRLLGQSITVVPAPLDSSWWVIVLLVLAALRAGLTEEVIFLGYLFDRLRRLGWSWTGIIVSTALLRGSYHLYQGWPSALGNVVMGLVFGWCYRRWGRVMPLVVAHTLIDVIAFVGYPLAAAWWPGVFAPPSPSPSPSA